MHDGKPNLSPGQTALPRSFYARDARQVAPALLNKILLRANGRSGRIVETEAYRGEDDPASHSHRGLTPRNAMMFDEPGLLYVYFTYGMHWCANAVCGQAGVGEAVLLRALEPLQGLTQMQAARAKARSLRDLCSGPAKLCQALGIDGAMNGADLVLGAAGVMIVDDGTPPPGQPGTSARVGITRATELPWRWFVPGNEHLSRR